MSNWDSKFSSVYIFQEHFLGLGMYLNRFSKLYHCHNYDFVVITFSRVNMQNGSKKYFEASQRTFKLEDGIMIVLL